MWSDDIEYDVNKKMLKQYVSKIIEEVDKEQPDLPMMDFFANTINCRIDDLKILATKRLKGEFIKKPKMKVDSLETVKIKDLLFKLMFSFLELDKEFCTFDKKNICEGKRSELHSNFMNALHEVIKKVESAND